MRWIYENQELRKFSQFLIPEELFKNGVYIGRKFFLGRRDTLAHATDVRDQVHHASYQPSFYMNLKQGSDEWKEAIKRFPVTGCQIASVFNLSAYNGSAKTLPK